MRRLLQVRRRRPIGPSQGSISKAELASICRASACELRGLTADLTSKTCRADTWHAQVHPTTPAPLSLESLMSHVGLDQTSKRHVGFVRDPQSHDHVSPPKNCHVRRRNRHFKGHVLHDGGLSAHASSKVTAPSHKFELLPRDSSASRPGSL